MVCSWKDVKYETVWDNIRKGKENGLHYGESAEAAILLNTPPASQQPYKGNISVGLPLFTYVSIWMKIVITHMFYYRSLLTVVQAQIKYPLN